MPGKSFEVSGSAAKSQKLEPVAEDEATVDSEDDIPLPFAAELGGVQTSNQGFALGALRARGHESHAAAVLVEPNAESGKIIELGRVHGDPEPPVLAFHGGNIVAVVPDNDAGGGMLRVGIIEDPKGAGRVVWGDDIVAVRREVGVGGVGFTAERGFIVFVSERKGQASLALAHFDVKTGKRVAESEALLALDGEAEAPRLVARKEGYWLGFLHSASGEKPAAPAKPAAEAGASEGELMLDAGLHTLEIVALDASGHALSRPIALTPARRHQLLFDIAPLPNGEALVAFRDDDAAPGAESGGLSLVRVRPDGTKEPVVMPGEKLEAGAPALLIDAALPDKAPPVWLAATGERNATWFSAVAANGTPLGSLQADTLVRGAALLAVHRGNILIGRSKGTSVELSAIQCRPDPLPPTREKNEDSEQPQDTAE